MTDDESQRQMALRSELHATLTNHLPIGLEGVADAQHEAVMAILHRYSQPRQRVVVPAEDRPGMRILHDLAMDHERSRILISGEDGACQMCRDIDEPEVPVSWPCPIWRVAALLGVVWDAPDREGSNQPDSAAG